VRGDPVRRHEVNFITDTNGNVARLEAPRVHPEPITEKAGRQALRPGLFQKFAGKYVPSKTITISLKGNVLFASVPGSPDMELLPGLGDEFTLKQMKVVTLRFKLDEKGNVTAAELIQPGGIFEAKRTNTQ
jgi:hypothetical protein